MRRATIAVIDSHAGFILTDLHIVESCKGIYDQIMRKDIRETILETFVSELKIRLGDRLIQVWLFGSQARGDADEGSDFDMLVIATGDLKTLRKLVRDASWVCMERHNALVAGIVYTPELWAQAMYSPLGANIKREGRLIA